MKTSITEALTKIRPDLSTKKKFRPLSPERRAALIGDYTEYDPEATAKPGELNPDEMAIGSEINRQLANEAQRRLVETEKFYRRHALSLVGLIGFALVAIVIMTFIGREDVRAGTATVQRVEAASLSTTVHEEDAATLVAEAPGASASSDDEVPVQAGVLVAAAEKAQLRPVVTHVTEPARASSAAGNGMIPVFSGSPAEPTEIKVASAAPVAAPATATFQPTASTTAAPALEDGAKIANTPSIVAIPVEGQLAVADDQGEVLFEAASAPQASAGSAPRKARSERKISDADVADEGDSDGLRVEGIFWDKTRPLALVNDKIVEVGASVSGAKVLDIQPGAVTLEIDGKKRVLHP